MDINQYISDYVNPEEISTDQNNPTTAKILSAGEEVETDFGVKPVFDIEINGNKCKIRFNKTSLIRLRDRLGIDTNTWINQEIKLIAMSQMVNKQMRKTIYVL